jgi:hypothetical protein
MRIKQSDSYQGNDWWEWAIWIDCTPDELGKIEFVTYTLHPSFHPPVRRVTDKSAFFRLEESGWGTFPIVADVRFTNGSSRTLQDTLKLHYPETGSSAAALICFTNVTAGSTGHADSLQQAILDAAPDVGVTLVRIPPTKGSDGSIRSSDALQVNLTGPLVAALARGVQHWLTRNKGIDLQLVTRDGDEVQNINADNIVSTLQSTMNALRK